MSAIAAETIPHLSGNKVGSGEQRKLRVVYIITRADAVGGSQVHVRDLSARLIADGHDAHVIVGGSGVYTVELDRVGVPWTALPELNGSLRHPGKDIAALWRLSKLLRQLQPDVVSTHTAKAGFLGRFVSRILRIPVLFTPHGWSMNPDRFGIGAPFFSLLERGAATVSTRIVSVCGFERSLALHTGIPERRLHVIHNGVHDVSPEERANAALSPPKIVMVARMESQKDHSSLLVALRGIAEPAHLEFIGNGPLEDMIKNQAMDLGLADRVTFSGYCEGERVAKSLASAQIFALITNFEAFPRSILEAMRAGLPVVATNVGGVSESVKDGETGYLVQKKDVGSIQDRLGMLIRDATLRKTMGECGRKQYVANFTFEAMYKKTLELYYDSCRFNINASS